jgi:hypothetical protein
MTFQAGTICGCSEMVRCVARLVSVRVGVCMPAGSCLLTSWLVTCWLTLAPHVLPTGCRVHCVARCIKGSECCALLSGMQSIGYSGALALLFSPGREEAFIICC